MNIMKSLVFAGFLLATTTVHAYKIGNVEYSDGDQACIWDAKAVAECNSNCAESNERRIKKMEDLHARGYCEKDPEAYLKLFGYTDYSYKDAQQKLQNDLEEIGEYTDLYNGIGDHPDCQGLRVNQDRRYFDTDCPSVDRIKESIVKDEENNKAISVAAEKLEAFTEEYYPEINDSTFCQSIRKNEPKNYFYAYVDKGVCPSIEAMRKAIQERTEIADRKRIEAEKQREVALKQSVAREKSGSPPSAADQHCIDMLLSIDRYESMEDAGMKYMAESSRESFVRAQEMGICPKLESDYREQIETINNTSIFLEIDSNEEQKSLIEHIKNLDNDDITDEVWCDKSQKCALGRFVNGKIEPSFCYRYRNDVRFTFYLAKAITGAKNDNEFISELKNHFPVSDSDCVINTNSNTRITCKVESNELHYSIYGNDRLSIRVEKPPKREPVVEGERMRFYANSPICVDETSLTEAWAQWKVYKENSFASNYDLNVNGCARLTDKSSETIVIANKIYSNGLFEIVKISNSERTLYGIKDAAYGVK